MAQLSKRAGQVQRVWMVHCLGHIVNYCLQAVVTKFNWSKKVPECPESNVLGWFADEKRNKIRIHDELVVQPLTMIRKMIKVILDELGVYSWMR